MYHPLEVKNMEIYSCEFLSLIFGYTQSLIFFSLYQEAPCSDGDIQSIDLVPSHPWRFSSPNFPSTKGYPHNVACNWKFKVKPEKVEKVSVICDHVDIAGNYYNECKGREIR